MQRLSGTALVVLGLLALRPRSGYEIKQTIDKTTRFFWNASYGQIYPELRRLAAAGLVEGEAAPRGGRARTIYRLTDEGRRRLEDWLGEPDFRVDIRDEGRETFHGAWHALGPEETREQGLAVGSVQAGERFAQRRHARGGIRDRHGVVIEVDHHRQQA